MNANKLKDIEITNEGWQNDWPTQPNTLWWFYGHRGIEKPQLFLVEVWETSNGVVRIAHGSFLYESNWSGKFRRVIPVIPKTYIIKEEL